MADSALWLVRSIKPFVKGQLREKKKKKMQQTKVQYSLQDLFFPHLWTESSICLSRRSAVMAKRYGTTLLVFFATLWKNLRARPALW